MARAVQKRRIETRARLVRAAEEVISETSYAALRVEEVVLRAGVAKGTFFAHFNDKDALLVELIGGDLNARLEAIAAGPAPQDPDELCARLMPVYAAMSSEQAVFDIAGRYSGAMNAEAIGPITENFGAQIALVTRWLAPMQGQTVRNDVPAEMLAEGVQAFAIQAMALEFCVLHNAAALRDRLVPYIRAWLSKA